MTTWLIFAGPVTYVTATINIYRPHVDDISTGFKLEGTAKSAIIWLIVI